ncbi:MAG: DUF1566 domain-containing protein [Desulfobacteraceae bacterium]|nr:DUF1566 domain-containing protein [Desulfobacteraceae bacterium]
MKRSSRFFIVTFIVVTFLGLFLVFNSMSALASDRFINNGDGTVTDMKTNLMWAIKDNGIPISWPNSLSYCKKYIAGGHTDWRMPTLEELSTLYEPKVKNSRGYHVVKPIKTTAMSCWASDHNGYNGGRFNFAYGKVFWLRKSYSGPTRVLPVRNPD